LPLNFDDNIFDTLSESMGEIFPELIAVFFQETELSLEEMQTALVNNNFNVIHDIAHKLKSSSKSFGAIALVEILEKIENSSSLEKEKLILEQQKLTSEYDKVKRHILAKSAL